MRKIDNMHLGRCAFRTMPANAESKYIVTKCTHIKWRGKVFAKSHFYIISEYIYIYLTNGSFVSFVCSIGDGHMSTETVLNSVLETAVDVTPAYMLISEHNTVCELVSSHWRDHLEEANAILTWMQWWMNWL